MRLLHTSDWHLGRSFHGNSTLPQLREVLGAIPAIVRDAGIDVVLVAGDVFDHAAPAAELYGVLSDAIRGIRDAGAQIVITSGNHDNAARLGFQSEWAALGGVHVVTSGDAFRRPIVLTDSYGSVDLYAIPYLEPMLHTALYPGEKLRTHRELLARVTDEIRELSGERGNRSVVMSHSFVAGGLGDATADGTEVAAASEGLVWDLTAGGVDVVPTSAFAGFDYVALGHIHGRAELAPSIRYSGAPVHFSFTEAGKPRGGWVVDLGAGGLAGAVWADFPIPRPLARLRGTLTELLTDSAFAEHEASWVEATLTDAVRPIDAMRRLRERFAHCAHIEFLPSAPASSGSASYAERVARKSEMEVVDEFLGHVRGGERLDESERELMREVLSAVAGGAGAASSGAAE
ncbi:MAG: exonuclease SbcCD subunit D [Leucobacter sp.]